MKGSPWHDLMQAYQNFIQRRSADQPGADVVSVICFDSTAAVQFEAVPLSSAGQQSIRFSGGGTQFIDPLQKASILIGKYQGYTPLLLFMSDGGDQRAYRATPSPFAGRGA